jgi:Holliday junction resolvasome RuvABC endonuclease subunit
LYRELVALARTFHVVAMIAELPSGGSKSSSAAAHMARGAAVFACAAETLDVVVECTTPGNGKKALTGNKNASKEDMMRAALVQFPGLAQWFKLKRGDASLPENRFEHVADAVGAFAAARGGIAEKLVVQLSLGGSR